MLEKLNNFFEKYLGISFIVVAVLITISFTLSHYKNSTNNYNAAEVYIGNLTYVVTIDDNNTQIISVPSGQNDYTIKIRSNESIMTNYKLLYKSNPNLTVKYGNISDTPQGNIKNEEKTVTLRVSNTSQDNINLELLVVGGYTNNDITAISIPNNYSEITESFIQLKTLYQTIIADNQAQSDENIDFTTASSTSNGQGLYYTNTNTENNERIYYYRGNSNSFVYFANFCWRIIHTNENGSIKMMYTGVKNSGVGCSNYINNTGTTIAYPTNAKNATTEDKLNYTLSRAKTNIDAWYQTNILSLGETITSKIEDYPFCNDTSNPTSNTSLAGTITLYGAGNRILKTNILTGVTANSTIVPSFTCQESDKKSVANGELDYPVATLTADEVIYLGGVYDSSTNSSTSSYWTMSPSYVNNGSSSTTINVFAFNVSRNNGINFANKTATIAGNLAPVISLKNNVYVLSGTGTREDPYIIN